MPKQNKKMFFVAQKNRQGVFQDKIWFEETLAKAKSTKGPPNSSKEEVTKADSKTLPTFLVLSREVEEELEIFRSFEQVLAFLVSASSTIQFLMTIEPAIKKIGRVEFENSERRIYSFDSTNSGAVIRAMRQARAGISAANQLPPLVLVGLVGAYDVILQKLIRSAVQSQDKLSNMLDTNIKLKDLKTFGTVQEAVDYLVDKEIDS